jgi:hypothetical protein
MVCGTNPALTRVQISPSSILVPLFGCCKFATLHSVKHSICNLIW